MPCISSTVHHQPTAARAKRRAMSPSRAREAAKADARPAVPGACSCAETIKRSGGPRELRGQTGLPLVLDAEGADLRACRLGRRQLGGDWVEDALEVNRDAGFDAEGDDVLDLEVDRAANADTVMKAFLNDLDRCTLDPQHLADEWSQRRHRAAL